jgi:hypothetical protein
MGVAVADSDEKWKVRCKEAFSRCAWMPTLGTFDSADNSNFAACAGQSDCWNVSRNCFPQADLQVPLPGDRISSLRKDEHANSQQTLRRKV